MQPLLARIAEAWRGTPFEGKAFLVGGSVRDELLGRPVSPDVDLVLEADAEAAAELLWSAGLAESPPVRYSRFGTAMLRIDGVQVELVTARRESYDVDSRKPHVEPATILEDARRRDFTVNTLMRRLDDGALVDPIGCGRADLEARILRTPGDPGQTFFDDPLRMLRAVRFRWQLGMEPAPGLYEAINAHAERLDVISAERIRDEWVKMLVLQEADQALRDLRQTGLLARFAPELEAMIGLGQGDYHHLDVWEHTLLVVREAGPGDLVLTLAALLHDVGKPVTRTLEPDGKIRFIGHERIGAEMALEFLTRLRFSRETAERVARLVRHHMRFMNMQGFSAPAARRLMRDAGDELPRLLLLVEADSRGLAPGVARLDLTAVRERLAEVAASTPTESLHSPLTGDEVMALTGFGPGPHVGELLRALTEEVIEGRIAPGDKAAARAWVERNGGNAPGAGNVSRGQ